MVKKQKIAIVGGGLTGLVMAYRLSQKGHRVELFEKEKILGGLAGGFSLGDGFLEKTYHHVFKTDNSFIALVRELGLQSRLRWYRSSVATYYGGKFWPFLTPIDLLKFSPLGIMDRIRLGMVSLYLQKTSHWKGLAKFSASQWIKKWGGEKAYRIIWEPLLRGKFHQYYDQVSMAWLWARIHTRASSKEKGGEKLGYMNGGFQVLFEKLAERIKKNGGVIKLGERVEEKELEKSFDKVISTAPIDGVNYLGAIMVVFSSEQNLSEYYWHNINDLNSPFLAFIQHTNLVDKKYYGNKNIYYLGTYLPHDHKFFKMSEDELKKIFFDYLKKIVNSFDEKKIEKVWVFKFKNAQHIAKTNFQFSIFPGELDFVRRGGLNNFQTNKKIIHVNFAQIFPEDRGMNYAVREAEKAIRLILTNES